jgi:hypothetical protein
MSHQPWPFWLVPVPRPAASHLKQASLPMTAAAALGGAVLGGIFPS